MCSYSFFFQDPATTAIYTLSLHDALPISVGGIAGVRRLRFTSPYPTDFTDGVLAAADRKSTRLNSSHRCSSYAVFCLKKKRLLLAGILTRCAIGRAVLALGGCVALIWMDI